MQVAPGAVVVRVNSRSVVAVVPGHKVVTVEAPAAPTKVIKVAIATAASRPVPNSMMFFSNVEARVNW
jgi:hypothetical protein